MDGGFGKRSHSQYGSESSEFNGRQKRRNQTGSDHLSEPSKILSDDIVYRVLYPGSKVGSLIGKGGNIIKSLRQETGAKIKIEDGIPGVDERVIIIATAGKDRDRGHKEKTRDKEDYHTMHETETLKDSDGNDTEVALSPAQYALLKIHERIVEGDGSFSDEEEEGSRNVTARLLVPNNQIGCLLGKGGKVIEKMRSETAAQIRILPKEQLPGCALPSDELVQISGEWTVVKKALHAVGSKLYENPSKDRPHRGTLAASRSAGGGGHLSAGAFLPQGNSFLSSGNVGGSLISLAPPISPLRSIRAGTAGSLPYDSQDFHLMPSLRGAYGAQKEVPEEEFVIRMLCPDDKTGSIIGRGGNLIRQLREETRAKIKIADAVPDSDDRVIIVSSIEAADSTMSPTLEAVLHLQHRIADLTSEKDGDSTTTRLLVPSSNIGCLLGRGGNVITEMRKITRASIRVMPKESLPRCGLESDELVQIAGDLTVARDALIQVVTRLRNNLFKEHTGNFDVNEGPRVKPLSGVGYQVNIPSTTSFEHRHDRRSPEALHRFSGLGVQGGSRSSFGNSSGAWGQGGDSDGLEGLSAYGSGASQSSGPFGRSGRPGGGLVANVSGTTLEILIPSSAVGSVIGKGGSNISHIREISGAKVKLHDGKPGATERTIEISGTPEQTQAAQSLLEAFLLSDQSQGSLGFGGLY
ncbi:hypothetical protein O6H91_07G129300 [Diphasiastrum complanatum]|uniref:Uncharacterized protein n=1 Tax=Diphasiastrum complanatum TaxID=34168 RepID=A0ACC2DA54_DIPCM|nr:hypothetical protein O6H91_07G129300 [Diphasiastrum complanatum]